MREREQRVCKKRITSARWVGIWIGFICGSVSAQLLHLMFG